MVNPVTVFHIKLLAMITMAIDHIGAFLFPEVFFLRIIGRLSFILFAWLLANGAIHTKNSTLYMKRFFLFALISEIPYLLIHKQHNPTSWELNIFFTLFLGLTAIVVLQRFNSIFLKSFLLIGVLLLAERFTSGFSYGAYGVVVILIFYLFYNNLKVAAMLQALAVFAFFTLPLLLSGNTLQYFYDRYSIPLIQPVALLSLIVLSFYNGSEGRKAKLIFYIFYPFHLAIIYLLMLKQDQIQSFFRYIL